MNLALDVETGEGCRVRDVLHDSVCFRLEKLPHLMLCCKMLKKDWQSKVSMSLNKKERKKGRN